MANGNTKQQNISITVDDGSIRVPVLNKINEEIGVFFIRPTDIGIIERWNKIAADFDKITAPLENININPDGSADENNEAEQAAVKEAEQRLYDACDYLFGGSMAKAFFGKIHPFSPVNGHFYCENALSAVSAFISRQFDREISKANSRVNHYTHGYQARTGKHRDGKK